MKRVTISSLLSLTTIILSSTASAYDFNDFRYSIKKSTVLAGAGFSLLQVGSNKIIYDYKGTSAHKGSISRETNNISPKLNFTLIFNSNLVNYGFTLGYQSNNYISNYSIPGEDAAKNVEENKSIFTKSTSAINTNSYSYILALTLHKPIINFLNDEIETYAKLDIGFNYLSQLTNGFIGFDKASNSSGTTSYTAVKFSYNTKSQQFSPYLNLEFGLVYSSVYFSLGVNNYNFETANNLDNVTLTNATTKGQTSTSETGNADASIKQEFNSTVFTINVGFKF